MQNETLSFNDYVKMSIDSGVSPLELVFYPIVDCESGFPVAYRTKTTIHSIILGDMKQDGYTFVSDERDCGVELFKHNVQHLISALKKFIESGREVKFFSVRCPSGFVEKIDLFGTMKELLQKNPSVNPEQICLEFPASLMVKDTMLAKTAVLDMKVLKVKTAVFGCGREDFYLSKLVTVNPDYVVLDKTATAYAGSRDKPQLLSSLIGYIKSMNVDVICEGTNENRTNMRSSDALGFIDINSEPLDFDTAVAQQETEL